MADTPDTPADAEPDDAADCGDAHCTCGNAANPKKDISHDDSKSD